MAIGIILRYPAVSDAIKKYDAVTDEMGVRNNPPQGAIYHWAAPTNGGLIIVDLWETQKDFDQLAQEKIYPLAQKHGFPKPDVEQFEVHNIVDSRDHGATAGVGIILRYKAGADSLALYDKVGTIMDTAKHKQEGAVIHWGAKSTDGFIVTDVWDSQARFDRFLHEKIEPATGTAGLSKPVIETFKIHNALSGRVRVRT